MIIALRKRNKVFVIDDKIVGNKIDFQYKIKGDSYWNTMDTEEQLIRIKDEKEMEYY